MQHCLKTTRFAEPFAEKYPRLVPAVEECLAEGERLAQVILDRVWGGH